MNTDAQLRILVAAGDQRAKDELRQRVRWQLIREIPPRRGVCSAGQSVLVDGRGAYSSGYLVHMGPGGGVGTICQHRGDVTWDPPGPRTLQLQALLRELL